MGERERTGGDERDNEKARANTHTLTTLTSLSPLLFLSHSPALAGDAEFYVQELVGMSVSLAGGAGAASTTTAAAAEGGPGPPPPPPAPLGTVVDVYSGTGPFDTLRIALSASGLESARAAAAVEAGAVIDEKEDAGEGGGGGGEGEGGGAPGGGGAGAAGVPATPAGDAPTLLLPFADAFVLDVCRVGRTMTVSPPPGLLGLAVGSADAAARKEADRRDRRGRAGRRRGRKAGFGEGTATPVAMPAPHDPVWEGRRGADAPGA